MVILSLTYSTLGCYNVFVLCCKSQMNNLRENE